MPVKSYWSQVEPAKDAVLWRFMDLSKFRDLMASEELYFRRADLFTEKSEGLPPEAYAQRVLGLDAYDINDRTKLNDHLGHLAQNREAYFISCWYLFDRGKETLDIWETYGHEGVAVCSRYDLLHSALNGLLDDAFLGRIQYGSDHLTNRFNALEFITTKQLKYQPDCEVRALIASSDRWTEATAILTSTTTLIRIRFPSILGIRGFLMRNAGVLISASTDVVISPWAEPDAVEEITLWVTVKGFPAAARKSPLTGSDAPTLAEFREHRHLFSPRPKELEVTEETDATMDEIERFTEEISRLPVERVRWLYKKRWDVLRLYPGDIPLLSDAQYLESTLRILDTWKKQKINVG